MQMHGLRSRKRISRYSAISLFLLVSLFVSSIPAIAQDSDSIATLRRMGKAFASIAEKASPAVVGIEAEKVVTRRDISIFRDSPFSEPFSPFDDDFFDRFFRYRQPQRRQQPESRQVARGSGFIISKEGYILTNNHLVGEAEKVTVKLADKREFTAEVVGTDPESDIAVIKIDGDNLPTVELGDSEALEVGEWVVAIGNPFGLNRTVTAGIVSAKGRSNIGVTEFENFIQTDAAINFGNSGGPLLNLDAKVVGMNTAIIGPGGNIGIGLAIPINMARDIRDQLIESGTVVRGHLGVWFSELTPMYISALDLDEDTKGVVVTDVIEDSPAEEAGLKRYDVIVEFEGEPVDNGNEFRNRVAMLKPGTEVKMVVLRDDKRKKITAELTKREPQKQTAATRTETLEKLGIVVTNLSDELAERFGYEDVTGVIVRQVDSGSEAARKGIKPGVLIMEVNRDPVKNTGDFYEAIDKAAEKGTVLLLVHDGRATFLVGLTLPKDD